MAIGAPRLDTNTKHIRNPSFKTIDKGRSPLIRSRRAAIRCLI